MFFKSSTLYKWTEYLQGFVLEIARLREGSCARWTTKRHARNSVVLVKGTTRLDNLIFGLAIQ